MKRKIHLHNEIWLYKIGKSHVVIQYPGPVKKKVIIDFHKLTGIRWDDLERARWKRYTYVTPATVRDYISSILSSSNMV